MKSKVKFLFWFVLMSIFIIFCMYLIHQIIIKLSPTPTISITRSLEVDYPPEIHPIEVNNSTWEFEEISEEAQPVLEEFDNYYIFHAPTTDITITKSDVEYMAKTLYGECRGQREEAKAAVAWCILNRVDFPNHYGDTLEEVITARSQFVGYRKNNPVLDYLVNISLDVLIRWQLEKLGYWCGRTLPQDYRWFLGYDGKNHFRNVYSAWNKTWKFTLEDPYEYKSKQGLTGNYIWEPAGLELFNNRNRTDI